MVGWVQTSPGFPPLHSPESAVALLTSFGVSTASADPPPGGVCLGEFLPATFVYNPDNPSFFEQVDKNRDGVVCLKDWTGPDPTR